jgi:hypothetical protein
VIQNRASAVRRSTLAIVAAGASLIIMFALASSAFAVEHHPKGEYASFADCPLSNPATELCIFAKTESGEFTIGKETVPIVNAVTLQGGIHNNGIVQEFIGAEDGNTLSKTPQKVPGGLAGLVKCNEISNFLERIACEVTFENGLTGVNATTELAAPASSIQINLVNLGTGTGTALQLPVKVHLENPFLGSNCTVGSNSNPIIIPLTTGTTSPPPPNNPISGSVGEISVNEAGTIVTVKNNVLVNNSFAAPEATGCGGIFSLLIDPLIDSKLSLPSAAGHNTAILRGTLKDSFAEAVKASE